MCLYCVCVCMCVRVCVYVCVCVRERERDPNLCTSGTLFLSALAQPCLPSEVLMTAISVPQPEILEWGGAYHYIRVTSFSYPNRS